LTSSSHRLAAEELFVPHKTKYHQNEDWTVLANFSVPSNYEYFVAYSRSKLSNILWAQEVAQIVNSSSISVITVHPGLVFTDITASLPVAMQIGQLFTFPVLALLMKPKTVGARSTLHAALSPEFSAPLSTVPYLENCLPVPDHTEYYDFHSVLAARKLLWAASVDYATISVAKAREEED